MNRRNKMTDNLTEDIEQCSKDDTDNQHIEAGCRSPFRHLEVRRVTGHAQQISLTVETFEQLPTVFSKTVEYTGKDDREDVADDHSRDDLREGVTGVDTHLGSIHLGHRHGTRSDAAADNGGCDEEDAVPESATDQSRQAADAGQYRNDHAQQRHGVAGTGRYEQLARHAEDAACDER